MNMFNKVLTAGNILEQNWWYLWFSNFTQAALQITKYQEFHLKVNEEQNNSWILT